MPRLSIDTPVGEGWVDLDLTPDATRLLLIGHGAGGGVEAPDIKAIQKSCLAAGISVGRVTQPYRVAGRKMPPSATNIDTAWAAIVAALAKRKAVASLELIFAGRSSGARVACRAATDLTVTPRPTGVCAVAFPVHPPGRPDKSRLSELDAVPVPVLVVQGDSDPFGMPPPKRGRKVVTVAGDHSLRKSAALVGDTVAEWIGALV